ncbi:MAG: TetR/AcrR family transcriptional regulator [Caulobacter sp.]|nr:TetR/AcrR family transcriptional regulator [Caulobacter sp.]
MTTRDRIFQAARAAFERDGLGGLSMRTVARDAGLSTMAIYRHFPTKDSLLDALMLDGFDAWEARVAAVDEADPVAWLEQVLAAFLDFAVEDPHRFDAAFLLRASGAKQFPEDFSGGSSRVISRITARIDDARAQGFLSEAPSLDIALTLSALAQGLVSMDRAGRFSSPDQFREIYQMAIANGLRAFPPDHRGVAQ